MPLVTPTRIAQTRVGVALLAVIAIGLLSGPAGLRPEPQSAEATLLSEVKETARL